MAINWYPGHMKKTHDLIKQHLRLVDCVVELIDARIPHASKNPMFDQLIGDKPRVMAMNKMDLADPALLKQWVEHFADESTPAVAINANQGKGIKALLAAVSGAAHARRAKLDRQQRINKATRMMIIGIPNVGKSTLINQLVGKKVAKTGNKPGVTRGKQWIRIDDQLELFDTPGILWPKIAEDQVGLHLAYTGSIKDDILPIEDIGLYFLRDVYPRYPELFRARYQIDLPTDTEPLVVMETIAGKRGCILPGKQVDYHRVARLILDEFRKGIIGKMTLETPTESGD